MYAAHLSRAAANLRDQHVLKMLDDSHSEIQEAITLAQTFMALLRNRNSQRLAGGLRCAAKSAVKAFRRLAKSFRRDYAAIKAGISLPWSTGSVEGQINRLTMLKRQMFGRASLDLLEIRVIHPLWFYLYMPSTKNGQEPPSRETSGRIQWNTQIITKSGHEPP
jgi:transposase